MTDEQQRHRVLAGISRSRLLSVLRRAPGPMGVHELADAVGLRPNTTREHLDRLVEAGLVVRERAESRGRGRPAFSYRVSPTAADDDPAAYRALASVLASELAAHPGAGRAAERAGERWGRAAVAGSEPAPTETDAVRRLVDLLADVGFAPEPGAEGTAPIRLWRCPFGVLARERTEVVCGVHLGLMRGALRALRAPLDAVRLEPFVQPNLCLAHLEATRHG